MSDQADENKADGDGATVDWGSIPEEGKRVIGTIVEAQVNSAVKPITEQLGSIAEQLKARDQSGSEDSDDSDATAGDDASGEGGDGVSAKVLEQIKKTNERLDAMENEKRTAEQTKAARKHAEAVVEKHHPKLKAKGTLIERIAQQAPDSEEAAEAARQRVIEEYKAIGVDTSGPQFGADPDGEGAKDEPEKAPGEESEDEYTARRRREIAERGKPVGLGG